MTCNFVTREPAVAAVISVASSKDCQWVYSGETIWAATHLNLSPRGKQW